MIIIQNKLVQFTQVISVVVGVTPLCKKTLVSLLYFFLLGFTYISVSVIVILDHLKKEQSLLSLPAVISRLLRLCCAVSALVGNASFHNENYRTPLEIVGAIHDASEYHLDALHKKKKVFLSVASLFFFSWGLADEIFDMCVNGDSKISIWFFTDMTSVFTLLHVCFWMEICKSKFIKINNAISSFLVTLGAEEAQVEQKQFQILPLESTMRFNEYEKRYFSGLERLLREHFSTTDICNYLNKIYGLWFVLMVLKSITICVRAIGTLMTGMWMPSLISSNTAQFGKLAVYCSRAMMALVTVMILCIFCQKVIDEARRTSILLTRMEMALARTKHVRSLCDMLWLSAVSHYINQSVPVFSACGLFVINSKIITTIMATTITYVIIVFQFIISDSSK